MIKFVVSITEVNRGAVILEAKSLEDAKELAMQMYYDGVVHWNDSEITDLYAEQDE